MGRGRMRGGPTAARRGRKRRRSGRRRRGRYEQRRRHRSGRERGRNRARRWRRWWRRADHGRRNRIIPRRGRGAVPALPRVLLHRIVDQIVDRALELARHLFELLPQRFSALKGSCRLLVRIRSHAMNPASAWLAARGAGLACGFGTTRQGRARLFRATLGTFLHRGLHAEFHEFANGFDFLDLVAARALHGAFPFAFLGVGFAFRRGSRVLVEGFDLR